MFTWTTKVFHAVLGRFFKEKRMFYDVVIPQNYELHKKCSKYTFLKRGELQ